MTTDAPAADHESASVGDPGRRRRAPVGLAAGLVVVAFNLRIAIAAVSPVLDDIQHRYRISSAVGGLLTTTPVICFGVFALLSPRLVRRFSVERLLWASMILLTAGIALRLAPSLILLFVATAIIGAAIAVANVLLPGLIKREFPDVVGLMTGLYVMALSGGAALGAGATIPLERLTGAGWQPTIALCAVPAMVAVVVWTPQLRRGRPTADGTAAAGPAGRPVGGLWRDPVARAVTGFMGLQSLGYYATLSWLPTLFQDHHMTAGEAGWMLSFSSLPAIAASLAAPLIAKRLQRKEIMVVLSIALCALAYVGLVVDPVRLSYVWMASLGLGQGATISLALTYIALRSPDPRHTAQLSTMAQGAGYLIASAGPFGLGALHDLTGGWTVPLLALGALLVPQLLAGLAASQERHVLSKKARSRHGRRRAGPAATQCGT
jgi:CP family cyanate transporter-like MFS transporter